MIIHIFNCVTHSLVCTVVRMQIYSLLNEEYFRARRNDAIITIERESGRKLFGYVGWRPTALTERLKYLRGISSTVAYIRQKWKNDVNEGDDTKETREGRKAVCSNLKRGGVASLRPNFPLSSFSFRIKKTKKKIGRGK